MLQNGEIQNLFLEELTFTLTLTSQQLSNHGMSYLQVLLPTSTHPGIAICVNEIFVTRLFEKIWYSQLEVGRSLAVVLLPGTVQSRCR